MRKKFLLIGILFLFLLSGCSSSKNSYSGGTSSAYSSNYYKSDGDFFDSAGLVYEEASSYDGGYAPSAQATSSNRDEAKTSGSSSTETDSSIKKVIVTGNAEVETLNFDKTIEKINKLVKQYDGYIQDSNTFKYAAGNRHANFTVRIPADKFSAFLEEAKADENFTRLSTSTKDITDSYYDLHARIESLEAEEKVVMDFYSKAETIDDLIAVENRLTEIRYELNASKGQMKNYELLTSYSTLNFSIEEVEVLTTTEDTFGDRLQEQCLRSWSDFKGFMEEALFWLIENVWYLIILLAIGFVIYKIVKSVFFKKKGLKKKETETKPAEVPVMPNVIENEKKE